MPKPVPKVAIVHDWLLAGGAERVVEALHKLYPDAPIYTSYATPEWRERLGGKVITGFLQHPLFGKLRKYVPFLRIWWFTHLDLSEYDIVISSSGAEAKGIKVPKSTLHINYCHAPTHYYWSRYDEYMQHPGFGIFDPLARLGLWLLAKPLRHWDYKAAQRPDVMIANSTHTQAAIKQYYHRGSTVIFPPVDISRFANSTPDTGRQGLLVVGRQTPYKRFDLAVQAATKLGTPLTVAGRGPDHERLVRLAGPSITFNDNASDADITHYMQTAEGFIFAGIDDFGIVAVEALAAGTPLIAYRAGGSLDYVIPDKTGVFFDEQTPDSLAEAITAFQSMTFDHAAIAQHAQHFSPATFADQMKAFVDKSYNER